MISKMVVTLDGASAETSPWPLACSNYYTVAIPENVALSTRNGDLVPMEEVANQLLITLGLNTYIKIQPFFDGIALSPVPISGPWASMFFAATPNIVTCVTATYAGYEPPTTSIAGTTITDTTAPSGTMPLPPTPGILGEVTTAIRENIGAPLAASQQAIGQLQGQVQGQIGYQLDAVVTLLSKLITKIESNIINTIGEVYQGSYPIGLGIPSTEQIISGEPVYSPYGIGSTILYPQSQPDTIGTLPTITPTGSMAVSSFSPTSTPTEPSPSPTPTSYETSTTYNPPPTTPPGVPCPAPVVQCPDPPNINFQPNIVINIPKADGTNVSVNVEPYTPTDSYTPTEPTPSPTPTDSEAPTPAPTPYLGGNYTIPTTPTKPTPPPVYHPGKYAIPAIQEGADWSSAAACGELDARGSTWDDKWLNKLLGITTYANANDFIKGLFAIPFVGPDLALGVWSWTEYIVSVIGSVPSSFLGGKFGKSAGPFFGLALAGLGEKIGLPLTFLTKGLLYDLQYTNPQTIPGETEFTSLYLANGISADEFTCMIQANGSYPSWWQRIAQANRTRISNEQIIQLDRRKVIGPERAFSMLRGNGVLNQADADLMYTASEALPTVSDIVRFMVRDADDNTVAERYGTDAALDTKYGKQLQSWAKGQGITDQVMKYYWRSHWEIPSNTALFEMLHRLRPARTGQGLSGGITVSREDIKDALVVNDILPFWADRLMEISFKPLTRTDAQRAYFIDAIDENELKDSYLDLGYNNDNADRLVRFTNQLKGKRKQATGGTEKATSVLKYYKNFLLSDVEASARLRNGGLSEKAATEAMQIATKQRANDSQLSCIKGVHSKYKRFIYGDNEARQDLTAIGVPIENIDKLVQNWNCERGNKPKELSAAQVCKAYKNELIDEMEYLRRLQAIGYGRDEAGIIFELCTRPPAPKTTKAGAPIIPKTQAEKDAQTAAARAVTQAALDRLGAPPQLPTEPPTL